MDTLSKTFTEYYFLSGGGEMGELIRQADWRKTTLGDPKEWPPSLRTAVGIMLDNPFGMYIAWGKEYIQLYNDGYRPILGSNKHPHALGISTRETFKEVWPIIGPMFDGVMKGQAVGFPDFMLPLNRNGFVEECYFDFSYSPIRKENGEVGGVLVTVIETTSKKKSELALRENESKLLQLTDSIPSIIWITKPNGYCTYLNKQWYEFTGQNKKEAEGFGWLEATHPHDKEETGKIFIDANEKQIPFNASYRLRRKNGTYRWALDKGVPRFDETGKYEGMVGSVIDMHEVKLAEEEKGIALKSLKESETKLLSIITAAPAGIGLFVGRDLIIELTNQTFIDIVGKGPNIVGKPLREVMPELLSENQPFLQILDEVYTSGKMFQSFGSPVKILRNGMITENFYNITYTPLFDSEGTVYAILDIAVDVTEQIWSRKKIEESEAKFRSLVEEAPVATCLFVGRELIIDIVNQPMLSYWRKGKEVLGKPLSEALPELEGQPFLKQLDDVFTTGKMYEERSAFAQLELDGVLGSYYFDYTYKPIRNSAGEVYAILEMAVDVTEQVLSKKALVETENNLRNAILQAPVAMCLLKEPNYVVEIANERMLELWGKTTDDVMYKPIFEGLPEAKNQGLDVLLYNVYTNGETFTALEMPVDLPRGNKIETTYINFVYEPFYDANGVVSGIMAVAVEVTEQVLARQKIEEVVAQRTKELAEANAALKQNNLELEQFAYIASHDMQEPLRKVTTFTQLLEASLGTIDERSKTYLDKIAASSARMSQLIHDILNFSQLSKDKEAFEPVNLNTVVQKITSDFELLIEEKGAVINFTNLPTLEAIPLEMQQLFSNLISNALKFSREDLPPVITIAAQLLSEQEKSEHEGQLTESNYYTITVEDNGIGFNQQYAQRIFNIFQRLHGKAEYAGTGIGLALCKKIAQNHHGEIWATSARDSGSVFHIILPEKHERRN